MKLLLPLALLITGTLAALKVYQVTRYENCEGNQPIFVSVTAKNASDVPPDQVVISGLLEVKDRVNGPLKISFDCSRCDFSMEKCEKYTILKVI